MKTKITAVSFFLLAVMALQLLPFAPITKAANEELSMIQNLRVTATDDYINIFWDRLEGDEEENIQGYAIAWGTKEGEVRADEIARQYLDNFSNSMSLRLGTFERKETYYFRIFGYDKDNKYQHNYGSKILKWSYSGTGATESSVIEPTDPVIVQNTTSNSDNTQSTAYDFGELRVTEFDTIARFFWSEPNLTNNEFDSIILTLSESNDLENPVIEAEIDKSHLKARVNNLKPGKTYYAAGAFSKNGRTFGQSDIIQVEMLPEADETGKRRLATLLDRIASSEGFGEIIDAKQYTSSTSTGTTTTTSTSTSTSNTSSNTTSYTSSSDFVVPNNASDINVELRRVQREMGSLEVQRRKLIYKLREIQS